MRKRILILFSIFVLFLTPNIVKAASANVQISAPSSVYVGEKVTVSVTISSSSSLGSWQYTIAYDDSILGDCSDSQTVVSYADNAGKTSVTNTWTFTAKGSGSASFSIPSIVVYSFDDESKMSIGGSTSTSINVVKPSSGGGSNGGGNYPTTQYKYSDDNNLSSLNVEGFDLNFDSSVIEYSITVPNDTKKVKIGASASDGKASVDGIGDYDVQEGSNDINVIVTAENGDKKTYKITVVVKELDPIEVQVDDKKFSVVRKADKLPKANSTYKQSTILIKGESVPCYHSEITDIYLIGLVNNEGKTSLYNYDSKNDIFNVYNEVNIGGLYISLIENKDVPVGYKTGMVKIGDKEYNGYLKDGAYPLLYGINLETGEKNFYSYDSSESTFQKYVTSVTKAFNIADSKIVLYSLIGLCVFEFFMIILSVVSKNRQLKKLLRSKLDKKTEYEKSFETSNNETYKDEDNITNDLTDEYMSSDDSHDDLSEKDSSDLENVEDSDESEKVNEETDEEVNEKIQQEDDEYNLGHTALISRDLNNVFNNSVNKKELRKREKEMKKKRKNKNNDDEMFKF